MGGGGGQQGGTARAYSSTQTLQGLLTHYSLVVTDYSVCQHPRPRPTNFASPSNGQMGINDSHHIYSSCSRNVLENNPEFIVYTKKPCVHEHNLLSDGF